MRGKSRVAGRTSRPLSFQTTLNDQTGEDMDILPYMRIISAVDSHAVSS